MKTSPAFRTRAGAASSPSSTAGPEARSPRPRRRGWEGGTGGDEAEIGKRLRAWWGDAPYDTEEWWEFQKFRDPER